MLCQLILDLLRQSALFYLSMLYFEVLDVCRVLTLRAEAIVPVEGRLLHYVIKLFLGNFAGSREIDLVSPVIIVKLLVGGGLLLDWRQLIRL